VKYFDSSTLHIANSRLTKLKANLYLESISKHFLSQAWSQRDGKDFEYRQLCLKSPSGGDCSPGGGGRYVCSATGQYMAPG
jgi:hypothetical protein